MTTPPAAFTQFGQTLAFAERSLSATLREHLAQRDTTPETWYALHLIGTRRPGLARETLSHLLEGSRNLNPDSTRALLARLEAEGLIRDDGQVDLTTEGETRYRSLREHVSSASIRLLNQFDIHDIETTVRTLQAITVRVEEEKEESPPTN
jgi:hypothetical protein